MPNQLQTNLENILNEKTTKILPENIKKNVQIFDVVGTLEAGSGDSSIKLYNSETDLKADTPNNGTIGMVYNIDTLSEYPLNTTFSGYDWSVPQTFILPVALTNTKWVNADCSYGMFYMIMDKTRIGFDLNPMMEGKNYAAEATSTDGINYSINDDNYAILKDMLSQIDNMSFTSIDDEVSLLKILVAKKCTFSVWKYNNSTWEALDLGDGMYYNAPQPSDVMKNKVYFSNNSIQKGTYVPVNNSTAFNEFYGIDAYTERGAFQEIQFFNMSSDDLDTDLPLYKMCVMEPTNNSPKYIARYGGTSTHPVGTKSQLSIPNKNLDSYMATDVLDIVTHDVYSIFKCNNYDLYIYNKYEDTLKHLDIKSNLTSKPSSIIAANHILYMGFNDYKVGVYNLDTDDWKVYTTGLKVKFDVLHIYNDMLILWTKEYTADKGRIIYKYDLSREEPTLTEISTGIYYSRSYDLYAEQYIIYQKAKDVYHSESTSGNYELYDIANDTKSVLALGANAFNYAEGSFGLLGKLKNGRIYFGNGMFDLSTNKITLYDASLSYSNNRSKSTLVMANFHPKNINAVDDWDYLWTIGQGTPDSYGNYDSYKLAKIYDGTITYVNDVVIDTYNNNHTSIRTGFEDKNGVFVIRSIIGIDGTDKYYIGQYIFDIFGFNLYPLNRYYNEKNIVKPHTVLHRNAAVMGSTEEFYVCFSNPDNIYLQQYLMPETDYTGTVTPTEYDTAVATSEDILGTTSEDNSDSVVEEIPMPDEGGEEELE